MAHDSPLLAVSVPDAADAADVPTHLENIVNKMERHATVHCTSSTRPASPFNGLTIWESDTKKTMVYYGGTIGWKPPWGSAWGVLGVAEVDQADITPVGQILTSAYTNFNAINVAVVANRLIAADLSIASLAANSGVNSCSIRLVSGAAETRMRGTPVAAYCPAFVGPSPRVRGYELNTVTGNKNYIWQGKLIGGGTAVSIAAPVLMTIMDVGPA